MQWKTLRNCFPCLHPLATHTIYRILKKGRLLGQTFLTFITIASVSCSTPTVATDTDSIDVTLFAFIDCKQEGEEALWTNAFKMNNFLPKVPLESTLFYDVILCLCNIIPAMLDDIYRRFLLLHQPTWPPCLCPFTRSVYSILLRKAQCL
jgi:hypothetical protein